MQIAWHRLRDGRAWHTLPWPRHANWLPRDLPGLWARMLWLLRTGREPEYGRDRPRVLLARHGGARDRPGLPYLQCGRRGIPERERGPWRIGPSGSTTSREWKAKARSNFTFATAPSMRCN